MMIKKTKPEILFFLLFLLTPIKLTAESSYIIPNDIPPIIFGEYLNDSSIHCSGFYNAFAIATGESEDRREIRQNFLDKAEKFNLIFTKLNSSLLESGKGYSPAMIMNKTQKLFIQYENLIFTDDPRKDFFIESIEKSCNLALTMAGQK